jgi:DnaK suppressor protein
MAKTKTVAAKKVSTKKAPAKKIVAKKTPAKKVVAKKAPAKKVVAKIAPKKIANNKSKIAPYKSKKNEKYMSAAMKRHFVAVLLLWKEHLLDEMQKTFDHLRTKGETYADPC